MTPHILVVDDNRANLDLMLYLLRAFGYECDDASDGLSGLQKARLDSYDLVLVDILMPGMDGYEFARRFKSALGDATRLIAITALAMAGDRERILQSGFDGYIAKPIDPERFVSDVQAYLGSSHRPTAVTHEQTAAEAGKASGGGPIILAVDDLQTNLDVLRASLAPFGYQIAEARSVREALQIMERIQPALILCDLHMPEEGGFALIEHVDTNERWRRIPFVFLSSTAWQTRDRRRGLELGAKKFILRPINPEKLRQEIEELIGDGADPHR